MRRHGRFAGLLWLALVGAGGGAWAQTPPPALPPEARQFDFWLGEWTVTTPDGKLAGLSRIERVADGAALLEHWTGAGGIHGESLNAWNAEKKQWQQFWVGGGGVLELAGGLVDGKMVLCGDHGANGQRRLERITWTPAKDGAVRQRWEQSADGGATWTVVFDGLYAKKTPPPNVGGGGGGAGMNGPRMMYFLFM